MTDFKANPELALEALKEITDELARSIRSVKIGATVPMLQATQEEAQNSLSNHVCLEVKKGLFTFWREHKIDEKLKQMKILEDKASTSNAWRPKTGIVNEDAIKAACLLKTKNLLEEKLNMLKKDNLILQTEVCEFSNLMNQQIKEVDEVSFSAAEMEKT